MLYRILCLALALSAALSLMASTGKYDDLIHTSGSWPAPRLMHTADSLLNAGADDEALVLYMIVTSRRGEMTSPRDKAVCTEAYLHMGDIHYAAGNYSNALKAYVEGLKISDDLHDKPCLAVLYKNMGNTYNELHSYEMGRYLYKTGLKEAVRQNDTDTQYKLLQNLAGVSILLEDIQGAASYYEELKKMKIEPTDAGHYMEEFILALILKGKHRYAESMRHFNELAALATSKKMPARYVCDAYDETAKILIETGDTANALVYLEKCVTLAEKSEILHRYADALKSLYTLYEEKGEPEAARKFKDKYLQIKDSIDNQQQLDNAKNQQFLYELEKTEKTISDLNRAQRESAYVIERQRLIMICSFVGIIIVLFLLWYFYRQKKRLAGSYRALYSLNRELAETHKESKEHQAYIKSVIEKQSDEIASLRSCLTERDLPTQCAAVAADTHTETDSESGLPTAKYSSSNLSEDRRNRLAEAIADLMENGTQFTSPDFSLGMIADLLDSNVKYISQVINEVHHKNFSSFVNDYRIRLACERFADVENYGHYSVRGIGESVGFKSHTSFTNAFKKSTGISPSVYQKLSAKEAAAIGKTREAK